MWEHNNNTDIPESIQVQLYKNGIEIGSTVTLSEENGWKYLWTDLEQYDENGNEHVYIVREKNVPNGYVASYSGNKNNVIITNTGTITPPPPTPPDDDEPEFVSKTVEKNGYMMRMEKIDQLRLLYNYVKMEL